MLDLHLPRCTPRVNLSSSNKYSTTNSDGNDARCQAACIKAALASRRQRGLCTSIAALAWGLTLILAVFLIGRCDGQNLNPNTKAPNFTLPTLNGPIIYKGIKHNETNIHGPIIFHEFTNHSGFLECLWTKDASILELVDNSPQNTQYVFLTSANDAEGTAKWMQNRFRMVLEKYYQLAKNLSTSVTGSVKSEIFHPPSGVYSAELNRGKPNLIQHRNQVDGFPKPKRRIDRRSVDNSTLPDNVDVHDAWHSSRHRRHNRHRRDAHKHGAKRRGRHHSARRRSVVLDNTHLPKIRRGRVLKHSNVKRSHKSKTWNWEKYEKHHGDRKKKSQIKKPDTSAAATVAADADAKSQVSTKPDVSDPSDVDNTVRSKIANSIANSVRSDIPSPPGTSPAYYNIYHYDKKGDKRSAIYRYTNEVEEDSSEGQDSDSVSLLEARVSGILKKGKDGFISDWLSRLHFVTIPLYEVGNWIPLVMSRWYCSGHGCGLDQISVEKDKEGDVIFVAKRLDARYDWLPSPYTLKARHPKLKMVYLGNGCQSNQTVNASGQLALVSREGSCSFYTKMASAQKAGALGVLVFTTSVESLVDMTCEGLECENEMKIPGTMIPYGTGMKLLDLMNSGDIYIRFQHSPSRNFFLAIDEQGKLQEVGWLLYPSMVFLTYQAKWLNYFTNLLSNINSMDATVVNVFNYTNMQGTKGVVKTISMPPLSEFQKYEKVYLDMALGCPGTTDYSCPHWDHTVQLYVCCDKTPLCGKEIGRWITPFRRRIGRWLTNITPLIPMFTSTKCKFTMKTVPWAMTWKPALKLRLADKKTGNHSAPYKVIPLFRGGKFDKSYNSKRTPYNFTLPSDVSNVKFFATITGHGSDNNNCAEFCSTSHHFVVNDKYKNNRVFDSAGTATGCADKVSEGSEPNEHGTWLYGRDGWCDGQNVSPWVEDITDQLNKGQGNQNSISYYGYFNGTDPNPTANPGYMIMYSYMVFYKNVGE